MEKNRVIFKLIRKIDKIYFSGTFSVSVVEIQCNYPLKTCLNLHLFLITAVFKNISWPIVEVLL